MMSFLFDKRAFFIGVAGALTLMLNARFSGAAEQAGLYQPRTLATIDREVSVLGLQDCPSIQALDEVRLLAVCRIADAKSAARLHWFLIDARQTGTSAIRFRSGDFGDADYVQLAVFSKAQDGAELILAESGAEFSYGVQVYALDGMQARRVGAIAEVLNEDGEARSVLPALQIRDHGATVRFSFTAPVMVPDRQGHYAEVAPEQVCYVLKGDQLRRVTDCR